MKSKTIVPGVGKGVSRLVGSKTASGDNYGTGFKAKVGKIRGDTVGYIPVSKKQIKTPPKSVV
jgi:hypothetical protein